MSKELDVSVTSDDLALAFGRMMVQSLVDQKKIRVLEARVDELDPPTQEAPDA